MLRLVHRQQLGDPTRSSKKLGVERPTRIMLRLSDTPTLEAASSLFGALLTLGMKAARSQFCHMIDELRIDYYETSPVGRAGHLLRRRSSAQAFFLMFGDGS